MELYPGIFKRVSSSYITKVPFTPPTKEEIKLKYKQLALIRHPDKPTGSDEEVRILEYKQNKGSLAHKYEGYIWHWKA